MSTQENRVIAYLISNLIGLGTFVYYVITASQQEGYDPATIPSEWGVRVLIAIGVTVLMTVILVVVATVLHAVITHEEESSLTDERDQLINLKANRNAYTVFGVSFLVAMIILAVGQPALQTFNLIVYALFGASVVDSATQLYLYRRGF